MTGWKSQLLESAAGIFGGEAPAADDKERIRKLQAKLGELTVEGDFFRRSARGVVRPERQGMIERGGKLSVKRQAQLLTLSRSSVYYTPRPVSERDVKLMRRPDELQLKWPFYGAGKLACELRKEGEHVGRRHDGTLMRRLGIEAL